MRDLAILFVHLLTTVAKLMGPGGARAVVAELWVPNIPYRRNRLPLTLLTEPVSWIYWTSDPCGGLRRTSNQSVMRVRQLADFARNPGLFCNSPPTGRWTFSRPSR